MRARRGSDVGAEAPLRAVPVPRQRIAVRRRSADRDCGSALGRSNDVRSQSVEHHGGPRELYDGVQPLRGSSHQPRERAHREVEELFERWLSAVPQVVRGDRLEPFEGELKRPLFDRLRQDGRDAARYVRRNPGFSFAIVLTLTLGIGLTTDLMSISPTNPLGHNEGGDAARRVAIELALRPRVTPSISASLL